MTRLLVPSLQTWKNSTKPRRRRLGPLRVRVDGRGTNMGVIDAAVEQWERVHSAGDQNAKLSALLKIAKACAWWLNLKSQKTGTQTEKRRGTVRGLLTSVIRSIRMLDRGQSAFARRAAQAIESGRVGATRHGNQLQVSRTGPKSLDGGYANERNMYVAINKQLALAAGEVHGAFPDNFDTMTVDDWVAYYNGRAAEFDGLNPATSIQVSYLPRRERTQYLAIPHGATFQRPNGTPMKSEGITFGNRLGDMYAIDRYGNMFVKDATSIGGINYFNHSSFNSGNDVMCAGVVLFNEGGHLVYIDNNSGHYKPTRDDLHGACYFLDDLQVPMDNVRVGVVNPGSADQPILNYAGDEFLLDPNGAQLWDNQRNAGLNLPEIVNA